jgi:hypothetical protein
VRRALVLAVAAAALAAPAPADAADCVTYPGDDAPQQTLGQWLAYGAKLRGIPGELPVMAALVESGVRNLPAGQSDSAGFFQMRISIWNQGAYAGFPTNPPLQLQWFIDQALAVRAARLVSDPGYGTTEDRWGEWIADVERPAEQFRYRYQLGLQESRGLIGTGCVPDGSLPPPATPPPATLDLVAPEPRLGRPRRLRRLRGLTLRVTCPSESCAVSAIARISVPAAARVYRVRSRPRSLAAGESASLTLRFGRRLRAALVRHKRRGRHASTKLTVTAGDAAGNSASERKRVRLF